MRRYQHWAGRSLSMLLGCQHRRPALPLLPVTAKSITFLSSPGGFCSPPDPSRGFIDSRLCFGTCPCCLHPLSSDVQVKPVVVSKRGREVALNQKAALEISRNKWLAALSPAQDSPLPPTHDRQNLFTHPDTGAAAQRRSEFQVLAVEGESDLESVCEADLETESASFVQVPHAKQGTVVLGIDPDVGGAIAILRGDNIMESQVFDVPTLMVIINGKQRRRHDARSIVELIHRVNVPRGSVAYIEQSISLPKDGKQGWWGSGFGFGVWVGILVASGMSVVPVPPTAWKRSMYLSGKYLTKDDCRASAALMFPSLASQLKRKKDHGRAEALLIAAYGKGIPAPVKEVGKEADSAAAAAEQC